jgi:hypothetical protein
MAYIVGVFAYAGLTDAEIVDSLRCRRVFASDVAAIDAAWRADVMRQRGPIDWRPLMLTFDDARTAVADFLASAWRPDWGRYWIVRDGFEDVDAWRVDVVWEQDVTPGGCYLVDKRSGVVAPTTALESGDRLAAMTPVPASTDPAT